MANSNAAIVVRILAVVALVLTVLAGIGWIVLVGGFGYLTTNVLTGTITGPALDPYWVGAVLSPILFIVMIVKSILMIIKEELFRKFFIIHILAVIAFIMTVIVLCFLGSLLVSIRALIDFSRGPLPAYLNAIFAGALLEVLFLSGAWVCHILAHLFGGVPAQSNYKV